MDAEFDMKNWPKIKARKIVHLSNSIEKSKTFVPLTLPTNLKVYILYIIYIYIYPVSVGPFLGTKKYVYKFRNNVTPKKKNVRADL